MSPQDLGAFTRDVVNRFTGVLTKQQRRVQTAAIQDGVIVDIDRDRIEQILENLLQNVVRYTPVNSTIDIAVYAKGKLAILSMRDHGPGIPADKLESIFDRYYQLNSDDYQNAGGHGVGLAIARKLARVHGGHLYVRNHPGGGAEFTLELPLLRLEKHSHSNRRT